MHIVALLFVIIFHGAFFYWLIRQFFDFGSKKFQNPKISSKFIIFLYLILMSSSGVKKGDETISIIFSSILVFAIIIQIIFYLKSLKK